MNITKNEKILAGLLAILMVTTIIQTIQLNDISQEVQYQEAKITTVRLNAQKLAETELTSGGLSKGGNIAVDKLKELPQMVGGC